MRLNPLRVKLASRQPCRGVWLAVPSLHSARLMARQPLDWLVVDAEHAPLDDATLFQMVVAITEAGGPVPLVRLAQATVENLKHALDAGAYGVIAPMINTRAEAEQVVAWARFPPLGLRSFGSPYAGLALGANRVEYRRWANEQALVMVQIESAAALDNLDAIFSTPGVDLGFVGPIDLSLSLGLDPLSENPHPRFQEALAEILAAGQRHNLPLGIYCTDGQAAASRIRQGFLLVDVVSDVDALTGAVRQELSASL